MKKATTLIVLIAIMASSYLVSAQTRVVCVGNSITAGYTLANSSQSWPSQLGVLLGSKYVVYNCGVSGTTMLKSAASSYWNTSSFTDAKNDDPNILIISLGTNDAHSSNWTNTTAYYNDYSAMIDAFRQNGRNPVIYVVYPCTIYGDATQSSNLQNLIIPTISQLALAKGATPIDYNTPTQNQRNNLYNDNLHPNATGALLLANIAYNSLTPAVPAFFQNCNYSGYGIKLGVGDYNFSALSARGINNDDISSIRVPNGYKVYAYTNDNFGGNYLTLTSDNSCLGGWDNMFTSIKVRANGVTGKNGNYSLQNRNSAKFMDIAGASTADGANVLQWTGTGATNQQFTLTDMGDGAYKIISVSSGKAVDVASGTSNNIGNILQWTYGGGDNQKFILLNSDNGYYKFKNQGSGRIIEIQGGGVNAGDNIDQYDDNNQYNGLWWLAAPGTLKSAEITTAIGNDANDITIYPNPATDIVTLTNVLGKTKITISDLSGKQLIVVTSEVANDKLNINVSNLKIGSYVVKIDNKDSKTFKLIKK